MFLTNILYSQQWDTTLNSHGPTDYVAAMTVFNNELIISGLDTIPYPNLTGFVKKWNGISWQRIGTGTGGYGTIRCLTVWNGDLIAGGYFKNINGIPANGVARWKNNTWEAFSINGDIPIVEALTVFNNELYVGGDFDSIAKWNGNAWIPVGNLLNNITIYSFGEYNNSLFAGGGTTLNVPAFLKLNGNNWENVGNGLTGQIVKTMMVYNNKLVVAGKFRVGTDYDNIANWDGTSWSLFTAVDPSIIIYSLYKLDSQLFYAGGKTNVGFLKNFNDSTMFGNSTYNNIITSVVEYDSNLIIGGFFNKINNDSIYNRLASWVEDTTIYTPIINLELSINNFSLNQNYPNPFNPASKIRFSIPKQSFVNINIYNLLGQKIKVLVAKSLNAGSYEVDVNADNLSSGIYFYEMTSGNFREIKKMILIK